jgi:tRNA-2-methylthio-N6-dimethylallyladenosine synthase
MTIAVAGCVAQAEGKEIMHRQKAVDLVVGPQAYHQLPELIARAHRATGERLRPTSRPTKSSTPCRPSARSTASPPSSPCRRAATSSAPSAWCPIRAAASGRGRRKQIEDEAKRLADQGVREVTLLGQNVNAYDGGGSSWRSWCAGWPHPRPGPHPLHDQPPARHGRRPDRGPRRAGRADALSAPAGAGGSDKILKAMNRDHTAESYVRLIEKIRAAGPTSP